MRHLPGTFGLGMYQLPSCPRRGVSIISSFRSNSEVAVAAALDVLGIDRDRIVAAEFADQFDDALFAKAVRRAERLDGYSLLVRQDDLFVARGVLGRHQAVLSHALFTTVNRRAE